MMVNTSIKPRVTVIITTYNRAETLRYAIESVMWQSFKNFELWIIGDGCTDQTDELINSVFNDPRIYWHNLPVHSGVQSKPLNEGIKRARGEYIAYLNQNDIWLPNHLETLVDQIDRLDADVGFTILQSIYSSEFSKPVIPLLPDFSIIPDLTALMHKKTILDATGYWQEESEQPERLAVEFFKRARNACLKFELIPLTTGLKFLWTDPEANEAPQLLYIERLKKDPEYINRELSSMLIRAEHALQTMTARKFLMDMVEKPLRKLGRTLQHYPGRFLFGKKNENVLSIFRTHKRLNESAPIGAGIPSIRQGDVPLVSKNAKAV
jgi:glycosyltransferase involved in cell wall biosynthesis